MTNDIKLVSCSEKKVAIWLLVAAIFGLIGVVLGAFGAHALKPMLTERGTLDSWETGVRYQMYHALGIAFVALWTKVDPCRHHLTCWINRCWTLGIFLFSGSIYLLATQGWKWLGPVTPLGGLCLMAGWVLLAILAFKELKKPQNG